MVVSLSKEVCLPLPYPPYFGRVRNASLKFLLTIIFKNGHTPPYGKGKRNIGSRNYGNKRPGKKLENFKITNEMV